MKKAILALTDGTVFEGHSFGAEGKTSGEVVFNTSVTGDQDIRFSGFACPGIYGMIRFWRQ